MGPRSFLTHQPFSQSPLPTSSYVLPRSIFHFVTNHHASSQLLCSYVLKAGAHNQKAETCCEQGSSQWCSQYLGCSLLSCPPLDPSPSQDPYSPTGSSKQKCMVSQLQTTFLSSIFSLKSLCKIEYKNRFWEKKKKKQQRTRCLAHICFKIVTPASAFISWRFQDWCFQRVHMLATTCECLKKLFITKPGK